MKRAKGAGLHGLRAKQPDKKMKGGDQASSQNQQKFMNERGKEK